MGRVGRSALSRDVVGWEGKRGVVWTGEIGSVLGVGGIGGSLGKSWSVRKEEGLEV